MKPVVHRRGGESAARVRQLLTQASRLPADDAGRQALAGQMLGRPTPPWSGPRCSGRGGSDAGLRAVSPLRASERDAHMGTCG
jgi:hypothetical protein